MFLQPLQFNLQFIYKSLDKYEKAAAPPESQQAKRCSPVFLKILNDLLLPVKKKLLCH